MPTAPLKTTTTTIIKSPFDVSPSRTIEENTTTQPTEEEEGDDGGGGRLGVAAGAGILPGNFDLDYQQRASSFPKEPKVGGTTTKRKSPSSSSTQSVGSSRKRPGQTARKGHGSRIVEVKKQKCDDDDEDDNKNFSKSLCPQDSYVCTDCSPFRILSGPESLANHCHEKESHYNINPLWVYNKLRVNVVDLGRKKEEGGKVDEYSSKVRAELERIRAVGIGGEVKRGIKMNLLEEREDENKNLS